MSSSTRHSQNNRKSLTDSHLKSIKPADRPFKVFDGKGLYLLVSQWGSKGWRFKYRYRGREKLISFGTYPEVSLKSARRKRDEARSLLAQEPPVDPSAVRKAQKTASLNSFHAMGTEWFADKQARNSEVTKVRNQFILDRLTDYLGPTSIESITTPILKDALLHIQVKHGVETARRARGIASRVMSYAIAHGQIDRDPSAGLQDVLKERNTKHRSAITEPRMVGELMGKIEGFQGQPTTRAFLQLLALNFTRPTEMRLGKWSEIDFQSAIWTIPAERMKMRRKNPQPHLIPLADSSIRILKSLESISGTQEWIFTTNQPGHPISENAGNNALRKLGYDGATHTCHGFRTTASTLLHQLNFPPEVIETQLAHARPGVAGIYNRSHLLPQRRELMDAWADHLNSLQAGV